MNRQSESDSNPRFNGFEQMDLFRKFKVQSRFMDLFKTFLKNDRFAVHSNVELISMTPGAAHAKMVIQPHHLNGLGTAMGGAIFTLADFAFAAASNSHGTIAVALDVNITFLKAARTGTLWADAKENSKNYKIGSYTVEVKDDAGELVALFHGTAYRKKEAVPGT